MEALTENAILYIVTIKHVIGSTPHVSCMNYEIESHLLLQYVR